MKIRLLKAVFAAFLICTLAFSLTGCDSLDYRRAVLLYNNGRFDAAADAFALLRDFENSEEMVTRSNYWAAITRAEKGKYEEALPRFLKLGDYEDSAQWAAECQYQMAVAAFNEARFSDAQALFLKVPDYRKSPEYLRQINWQTLYDAVVEAEVIRSEQDGKIIHISPDQEEFETTTDTLYFTFLHYLTDQEDPYSCHDRLVITLTRDSTEATFSASSGFQFDLFGGEPMVGSRQIAEGRLDITACTPDTRLVFDTFEKTVTDNFGNTTTSTDPADSLMDETLEENFRELMITLPVLLQEAGISVTLSDIGFYAMQ